MISFISGFIFTVILTFMCSHVGILRNKYKRKKSAFEDTYNLSVRLVRQTRNTAEDAIRMGIPAGQKILDILKSWNIEHDKKHKTFFDKDAFVRRVETYRPTLNVLVDEIEKICDLLNRVSKNLTACDRNEDKLKEIRDELETCVFKEREYISTLIDTLNRTFNRLKNCHYILKTGFEGKEFENLRLYLVRLIGVNKEHEKFCQEAKLIIMDDRYCRKQLVNYREMIADAKSSLKYADLREDYRKGIEEKIKLHEGRTVNFTGDVKHDHNVLMGILVDINNLKSEVKQYKDIIHMEEVARTLKDKEN